MLYIVLYAWFLIGIDFEYNKSEIKRSIILNSDVSVHQLGKKRSLFCRKGF